MSTLPYRNEPQESKQQVNDCEGNDSEDDSPRGGEVGPVGLSHNHLYRELIPWDPIAT